MRDGWREAPATEFVAVNPKVAGVHSDSPFITMADVAEWGRWAVPSGPRGTRGGVRAQGGDTLVARITPCLENGKIAQVPTSLGPVGGSTEFIVLRAKEDVLPDYVYLWAQLRSTHGQAVSKMIGSTGRQRVSSHDLGAIAMRVPPLSEQERIVDLIGAVDYAIEAAEVALTSAREAAKRVRGDVFSVLSQEATAPAGHVFAMLLGRQKSARQSVGDYVIPYLRAANISSDGLLLSDVQTMNFAPAEQERYCLEPGDVMLVEGGSLGQSFMWSGEIAGPVGFDKHVIRLRPVEGRSTKEYALQWTRWAFESGAFDAQATGATIRALGFGRASAMPVPDISLAQQDHLTDFLGSVDSVVMEQRRTRTTLRNLRANLLTALLSGEHEIPDSYDELMEQVS